MLESVARVDPDCIFSEVKDMIKNPLCSGLESVGLPGLLQKAVLV